MTRPARRRRTPALLVGAALALTGVIAAPAEAAPPTVGHVNLGDSYSAAVGTGGLAPTAPLGCVQGSGPDHVSRLAEHPRVELLLDAACSGATSAQVAQVAQLPVVQAALAEADLVTLTAGGNDMGWTQFLVACSRVGEATAPGACDLLLAQADGRISAAAASVARMHAVIGAATDARVVHLGYPLLLAGTDSPLFTAARATELNALTEQLDAALAEAATGQGAVFVDVTGRFDGHAADSADPWIVLDPANPTAPDTFHPTSEGYLSGYLPALRTQVSVGGLGRR